MPKPNPQAFSFKQFQIEDLARAALVDGAVVTWEPGMGKTLAAIALAIIKKARRVLLVVPGQLHRDFRLEALKRFGVHLTSLTHRQQLHGFGIDKPLPAAAERPRFFVTTYHELGYNNTSNGAPSMAQCIAKLIKAGAGFDCVEVDEGTHLQSGYETHVAAGVLILDPQMRYVFTGTPSKNRLESFFWLGWWAARDRWPYEPTNKARDEFARDHLMSIRTNGHTERTARLTNVHHLWKVTAPVVIRRRKLECGEDVPPKIIKPIVLQPGTQQAKVYVNHLFYPPVISSTGRAVSGFGQVAMQLNYLRQAALAPHSPSLGRVFSAAEGIKKTDTDFNPKLATCLSIIAKVVRTGEQIIIGSPFRAFSHSLHARLIEAGVSSLLLDGETPPDRRGKLAQDFKTGRYSVLTVGLAAMSHGFNFDNCSHLILPALSWAYDENEQFINRVWRITSKKPVMIYMLSIAGTIDERLAQLFTEKSDSAQLAFDWRLIAHQVEDVDLADLLKHSIKSFNPDAGTIDEAAIAHQWSASLCRRLTRAEERYRQKRRTPKTKKQISLLPHPTRDHPNQITKINWREIHKIVRHALAA